MDKIKEADFLRNKARFENAVKDVCSCLDNISSFMKPIDGNNLTWSGKTAQSVSEQYLKYESNFADIKDKLNDFCSYLGKAFDNYQSAMIKSNKTVAETADNFNINA